MQTQVFLNTPNLSNLNESITVDESSLIRLNRMHRFGFGSRRLQPIKRLGVTRSPRETSANGERLAD